MRKFAVSKVLFIQVMVVAVISALIFNVSSSFANFVMMPAAAYNETIIIIDAGHGDFDPGAIAHDGTAEKDINLQIALKLADFFRIKIAPVFAPPPFAADFCFIAFDCSRVGICARRI